MYRGTARTHGCAYYIFNAQYMGYMSPDICGGAIGLQSTHEYKVFIHFSEWSIPNGSADIKATEMTLISNAPLDERLVDRIERQYCLAGRRIHPRHYEREEMLNALSVLFLYLSLGEEKHLKLLAKVN